MLKQLQRILARFWPVAVTGDEKFGYTARLPWDKNSIWASKRENAIQGCRQRGMSKERR